MNGGILKIGLIGHGAMASYVAANLAAQGGVLAMVMARAGRENAAKAAIPGVPVVLSALEVPVDLIIDCAGHQALSQHGPAVLAAGIPLLTASIGALADDDIADQLHAAAQAGKTRLHLATGAIGALDMLASAKMGKLDRVTYSGRKPPQAWLGSRAEDMVDLENLDEPFTHFEGSAREAALLYPKNANVAAAVALAGIGFDATEVRLVADPRSVANTHKIGARGAFGTMRFSVTGVGLPNAPRTSALAAMSILRKVSEMTQEISF